MKGSVQEPIDDNGGRCKGGNFLDKMTKIVTPKALGEGRRGSATDRDVDNPSGGREDWRSIGKRLKKGLVESQIFLVNSSIFGLGFYGGGRGSTSRRGGEERRHRRVDGEDIVSDRGGMGIGGGEMAAGSSVCSK